MKIWAHSEVLGQLGNTKSDETDHAHVSTIEHSIHDEQRIAVLQWMNSHLAETRLSMGRVGAGIAIATTVAVPGLAIAQAAARTGQSIAEQGLAVVDVPANVSGMAAELAEFCGSDLLSVEGAMNSIGCLPVVGAVFGLIKATGHTVVMIMTALDRSDSAARQRSSCSGVEKVGLEAVVSCETTKLSSHGVQLGKALLGAATAPLGLGLVKLSVDVVVFTVKYALFIKEMIDVAAANRAIAAREIDEALLAKHPVLGLTLPHLRGVDALPLMGILPLGWGNTPPHPGIERLRQQSNRPENRWMLDALAQLNVFDTSLYHVNQIWVDDLNRVAKLMVETSYHLYEARYRLYDDKGEELFQPPPITAFQIVKEAVKRKIRGTGPVTDRRPMAQAATDELRGQPEPECDPAELEGQIKNCGGAEAAMLVERTQDLFGAMGEELGAENAQAHKNLVSSGPVARLVRVAAARAPSDPEAELGDESAQHARQIATYLHPDGPTGPADSSDVESDDDGIETIHV